MPGHAFQIMREDSFMKPPPSVSIHEPIFMQYNSGYKELLLDVKKLRPAVFAPGVFIIPHSEGAFFSPAARDDSLSAHPAFNEKLELSSWLFFHRERDCIHWSPASSQCPSIMRMNWGLPAKKAATLFKQLTHSGLISALS